MTQQEALLVLNAVHGLGARRIRALMDVCGSAVSVLNASEDQLLHTGLVTPAIVYQLKTFDGHKFLQEEFVRVKAKGATLLMMGEEGFPVQLTQISEAPVCVYVLGDVKCLHESSIGMVGSRAASIYGLRIAHEFARTFARQDLIVVSGLARGIDASSHQGALKAQGKTIGVIGCGLNHVYPKMHAQLYQEVQANGAIVSEYPMDTPPHAYNFPWRNRIISGLSQAVVVIEAAEKSGALITATYASEQGKDVYVVPANVDNLSAKGSNQLVKDGALVALEASDVLMGIGKPFLNQKQGLTEEENQVNLNPDCLYVFKKLSREPQHIDQLLHYRRLNCSQWHSCLLELQLLGLIQQLPGQYYIKV